MWLASLPMGIGFNDTTCIGCKTSFFKLKTTSKSVSADRDKSNITIVWGNLTSLQVLKINFNTFLFVVFAIFNGMFQQKFNTLLFKSILEGKTDLLVNEWAATVSELNNSDFSSETLVN